MTYQAYLDTIKDKTGMTPADFRALAEDKGLLRPGVKAGEVLAWLKSDYGLGHGHAMAMYGSIRAVDAPKLSTQDRVDRHFAGARSAWRPSYDKLMASVHTFGDDVSADAGSSYISLLRSGKKFAIVKVATEHLDIGIKLKGVEPTARLAPSGTWNAMVTHRVRVSAAEQLDAELVAWLGEAYAKA
jgi:hypothetical protein